MRGSSQNILYKPVPRKKTFSLKDNLLYLIEKEDTNNVIQLFADNPSLREDNFLLQKAAPLIARKFSAVEESTIEFPNTKEPILKEMKTVIQKNDYSAFKGIPQILIQEEDGYLQEALIIDISGELTAEKYSQYDYLEPLQKLMHLPKDKVLPVLKKIRGEQLYKEKQLANKFLNLFEKEDPLVVAFSLQSGEDLHLIQEINSNETICGKSLYKKEVVHPPQNYFYKDYLGLSACTLCKQKAPDHPSSVSSGGVKYDDGSLRDIQDKIPDKLYEALLKEDLTKKEFYNVIPNTVMEFAQAAILDPSMSKREKWEILTGEDCASPVPNLSQKRINTIFAELREIAGAYPDDVISNIKMTQKMREITKNFYKKYQK